MLREVDAAVRSVVAEQRRASGADLARKRLQAVQAELARLVEAAVMIGVSEALATRLRAAEAETAALEMQIAVGEGVHDAGLVERALSHYRSMLAELWDAAAQGHSPGAVVRSNSPKTVWRENSL